MWRAPHGHTWPARRPRRRTTLAPNVSSKDSPGGARRAETEESTCGVESGPQVFICSHIVGNMYFVLEVVWRRYHLRSLPHLFCNGHFIFSSSDISSSRPVHVNATQEPMRPCTSVALESSRSRLGRRLPTAIRAPRTARRPARYPSVRSRRLCLVACGNWEPLSQTDEISSAARVARISTINH